MMNRSYVYGSLLVFGALTACGDSAPDEQRTAQSDRVDTTLVTSASQADSDAAAAERPLGATVAGGAADGGQPASTSSGRNSGGGQTAPGSATAPAAASSTRPVSPASAPAADPDANAILKRAEQVYDGVRSLEADFTQQVTIPLLDQTQRSAGKIYHRRPDRFAMRFSDPEGDLIVADGRSLWMYYPSTDAKQVIRSDLSKSDQQVDLQREFLSDATTRFNAVLTGTESVAGRPAHVLVLTPRGQSPYRRVRLWIDQQDHLVRRFEILEQNESLRRLELRNIRSNPTLSDDLFRFTPPPGTQVFEH